ncbi:MAG: coproporphyrinogen III oxidase [Rickettsiaceae bacterium]|nr:coproporphyrinogen III oxidase [Rickettsiaceae bacterium]
MQHKKQQIAVYIHWPFCLSKCPYCDFNSHVLEEIDESAWRTSYEREIDSFTSQISGRYISSIFFGGGTPSLMPPSLAYSIINKLHKIGSIDSSTEVTLEANPTSSELQKFRDFKSAGVNRISIGVQSLRQRDLEFLGRKHNISEALNAIEMAKNTFDRTSFDIIYARPLQTLSDWKAELSEIVSISADHLSLYQLTIEKGTPFFKMHKDKHFELPENDLAAEMYNWTNNYLSENRYYRYEISNYAKAGNESRHNLAYWNYDEYVGIGAGAHSRIREGERVFAVMNIHSPAKWQEAALNAAAVQSKAELSEEEVAEEILMMGLRLKDGISDCKLQELLSLEFSDIIDMKVLQNYIDLGLAIFDGKNLKLTDRGLLLHGYIVPRLLSVEE